MNTRVCLYIYIYIYIYVYILSLSLYVLFLYVFAIKSYDKFLCLWPDLAVVYIYSYIYKDRGPHLYRYIVSDLFVYWYWESGVYTYVYIGYIYCRQQHSLFMSEDMCRRIDSRTCMCAYVYVYTFRRIWYILAWSYSAS